MVSAPGPAGDYISEVLAQRRYIRIDQWLRRVATRATARNAVRLEAIVNAARQSHDTVDAVAQAIEDEGLARTTGHAMMLARTNASYAYNAGLREGYREQGVAELEWVTAHTDTVCEACMAMDGRRVPIEGSFSVEDIEAMDIDEGIDHPPLHPNCMCSMVPVLASEREQETDEGNG